MAHKEPFGTTPIPTSSSTSGSGNANSTTASGSLEVTLDVWGSDTADVAQQPQTQQLAVYEATPNEECINGSLLDVNQHFVVYAVKNGLIRVLHRHSAMRALLRGHQGQVVTDMSFFLDGDVLATVGQSKNGDSSTLIVWRVFEHSPDIQSEKLLEVSSPVGASALMSRLLWHPFNPNQLWAIHSIAEPKGLQVATLIETTRIQTTVHPEQSHPVCHWHSPTAVMEGAVQLKDDGSLTDLAWSGRDTRHVLTVHQNGRIILWDLKQTQETPSTITVGGVATTTTTTMPKQLAVLVDIDPTDPSSTAAPQSRCKFLPHENAVSKESQAGTLTTCFVTASHNNSVITLWSSFTESELPVRLQVLKLAQPSPSYVLDLCFGPAPQEASPPSCFLLWADRHSGKLLAVHVSSQWSAQHKALCLGGAYVVPFVLKHAIYSWCVVCAPTQDISDEDIAEQQGLIFDMKLFSYQSKVVQCLTLTSYMCLPPEEGYQDSTPGVTIRPLMDSTSGAGAALSEVDTVEPEYDEEYDVDEDEDDEQPNEDGVEAPEPSALPAPDDGLQNPFANWLGAIAMNKTPESGSDMPPPPPPPTPATDFKRPTHEAALMLPPGIPAMPGMPPGMPGTAAAPPGLTAKEVTPNGDSLAAQQEQPLLNPMDLLAGGAAAASEAKPAMNEAPNDKGRRGNAGAPNKQKEKKQGKKSRSKSPKGRKPSNAASSQPTFPDGAKISILKREDKTPPVVAPTLPDTTIVEQSVTPAPSAADLEAAVSRVVAQEFAKQRDLTEVVEEVLQSRLVPAVEKVVKESLAAVANPLQSSIDRVGQQGVRVDTKDLQSAIDLESPIKAAMADAMRHALIPAVESITAQLLQKVAPPPPPPPPPDHSKTLEAMAQQLVAMNGKMEAMAEEMKALKGVIGSQQQQQQQQRQAGLASQQQQQPPPPQAPPSAEAIRNEIMRLIQSKQFEAAFAKAVSTTQAEMAVFACSRADASAVLGGNAPTLSQPILLCLMQQLGAALATTTAPDVLKMELDWLQEIALTLNPADPNINRHVPSVLQQLVAIINQRMAQGNPQFRRQLQMLLQIIRGMGIRE